jgi:Ser/Thr protein kinase RdoA (MazF antagonist)
VPFASISFTNAARHALLDNWGIAVADAPVRLFGGEESAAYRVDDYVVRISPRWRMLDESVWCNGIAQRIACQVVEAIAPITARGGVTAVRIEGRTMSVWPFIRGSWPDINVPGISDQAADLLARIHRALAGLQLSRRPVPSILESKFDDASNARRAHDPQLDNWLIEFHRRANHRHLVHGDFYPGNTLARDGHLIAVFDWDESCVLPPEAEVATAAMEWTGNQKVDLPAMRGFAERYARSGGTATSLDDETLIQFIRHRLRCEAKYFQLSRERGVIPSNADIAYEERRLELFRLLQP